MKKIININLSGRVIPIEDSAYEKLQGYIESLRRYFAHEESREEIINDIESRIAELLHEKIRKGATAIVDADIDEIAQSMGRPEDFEAEQATETTSHSQQQSGTQQTFTAKKSKGRLYRDTSDKFIGGVCSGLAAYMNVDPAIVRILFAIITFGGFGLGFFVYILLWMILPPKDLESYSGKRLYRNPDDRMIGGVAGGLAAYFGSRTSVIRLIFAAPILLSVFISILRGLSWGNGFDIFPNIVFGSLSGTFILAYVVLWMVLPEAHSTYEKMEMRGEKVDVNSIRQNVKEGVDSMKEKVQSWSEEVRESAQNMSNKAREFTNTRGKAFAAEVSETVKRRGSGLGHAIGVLFKVFFLFIAGTIAFGLFVALIALLFGGVAWWPINNFVWTSDSQQLYAWGTLIFFLVVPLVAFIIWVVRRILRVRSRNNYLGWTFGFLWAIGWVAATLLTASLVKDHREHEYLDTVVPIVQPPAGKMIVTVTEPELSYTGRFDWMNDDGDGWDLSNDTLKLSTVDFDFDKSSDQDYHVIIKRYSFGRTTEEAKSRANKIQYRVSSKDSLLDLANSYAIDKESKFRWQYVEVLIQIPVGKKIRFDRSVNEKLNVGNFNIKRDREREKKSWSYQSKHYNYYSSSLPSDVDYVMGEDNILRDASGTPAYNTDDYRYNQKDKIDTNTTIEEQRIKVEEEQRRLKQMEQQEKQKQKPTTNKQESMDKNDGSLTGTRSPIISLVSWVN